MILYAFYFLSFLAVLGALMMVFSRNPVYSVIYLVMTFFTLACHYMLLSAQFLAAVHVIVYAGAIVVLFLYVIMMMNLNEQEEGQKSNLLKIIAVASGGLLMVVLVGALRTAAAHSINPEAAFDVGTVKNLGRILLNEYLLPFEAVSILLLTAMVGAVMLAKTSWKKKPPVKKDVDGKVGAVVGTKEDIQKVIHE